MRPVSMDWRKPVLLLASISISPTTAALQTRPVEQQVPRWQDHPRGAMFAPGKSYIDTRIASPIQPKMWEHYCRLMGMSDAQALVAASVYQEYRSMDWQVRMAELQPLIDATSEFGNGGVGIDVRATEDFTELIARVTPLRVRLAGIEDHLFSRMSENLTVDQIERLQTIRRLRKIDRSAMACALDGALVNLDTLLVGLETSGLDIGRDNPETRAILDEYALVLANRAAKRCDDAIAQWPRALSRMAAGIHMASTGSVEDQAAALRLDEDSRREMAEQLRDARWIVETNDRFVDRLAASLPAATHAALREQFKAMAYPPVYPDPCDLNSLSRLLFDAQDKPTQSPELKDSLIAYSSALDTLIKRQEKLYLDFRVARIESSGRNGHEHEEYAQQMRALDEQRAQIAITASDLVLNSTAGRDAERIAQVVGHWKQQCRMRAAARAGAGADPRSWPPINQ